MTHIARHALRAIVMGASLSLTAAAVAAVAQPAAAAEAGQGVIRVQSAYGFDDTVTRIKSDIAGKGIRFFTEIDQANLARSADIPLRPSKLLIFGNPPLGAQFLTSNPFAGLDWPVRILVTEDAQGRVWVAYTDFAWIADRYEIRDRQAQIKMAGEVAGSIAGSVSGPRVGR